MSDLKVGDRIRLVRMGDDPDPIEPGAEGTVTRLEEDHGTFKTCVGQVGVHWDSGRTLALVVGVDVWEKIDG